VYCNVETHRVSENLSQYLAGGAKATCWSGKESNRQTLPILSENMSRTFKKVDDDRVLDLTVRLGDCLPPNHLARFVVDSVYIPGFCGSPAIPVNLKQAMEHKEKGP
jgi:hypothetical protein